MKSSATTFSFRMGSLKNFRIKTILTLISINTFLHVAIFSSFKYLINLFTVRHYTRYVKKKNHCHTNLCSFFFLLSWNFNILRLFFWLWDSPTYKTKIIANDYNKKMFKQQISVFHINLIEVGNQKMENRSKTMDFDWRLWTDTWIDCRWSLMLWLNESNQRWKTNNLFLYLLTDVNIWLHMKRWTEHKTFLNLNHENKEKLEKTAVWESGSWVRRRKLWKSGIWTLLVLTREHQNMEGIVF